MKLQPLFLGKRKKIILKCLLLIFKYCKRGLIIFDSPTSIFFYSLEDEMYQDLNLPLSMLGKNSEEFLKCFFLLLLLFFKFYLL